MTIFTSKKTLFLFLALLLVLCLIFGLYNVFSAQNPPDVDSLLPESKKENYDSPSTETVVAPTEVTFSEAASEGFFANYRLDRNRVRGQQVELLQSMVENPNTDAANRKEAQNKMIGISDSMDQELQLEVLIKAKGFTEAAFFIQPESTTAVLEKENLSEAEVTTVADIISQVTGHDLEDIIVIPK